MNFSKPVVLALLILLGSRSPGAMAQSSGIAVVELFTSQGCSSCPPADAHLSRLAELAQEKNLAIFPLSFHVDYWNDLGWDDPFSAPEYSRRQRRYAALQKSRRIYTPQMIVNGTTEFVGSDRKTGAKVIGASLKKPARVDVELTVRAAGENSLLVDYKAMGALKTDRINLAVVQTPDATNVHRGENSGRCLTHVNVVRAFRTLTLAEGDNVSIQLPTGVSATDVSVIAYVQESDSLAIVGAAISKS